MNLRRSNERKNSGVIMAACDLLLVIPAVVLGIFFLIDAGLAAHYKSKLGIVLLETAEYAANLPPDVALEKAVNDELRDLLRANSVRAKNIKVTTKRTSVADVEAIMVSATTMVPLLEGGILPIEIPLSDTATALIPPNKVYALIAVSPSSYSQNYPGRGLSVYIPIVRPRAGLPIWSFPYDTAIGSLNVVKGSVPTIGPQNLRHALEFGGREPIYY